MSGTGVKLGTSGGFQLVGQSLGSKLASDGTSEKSELLTEQQSLSAAIKPVSKSESRPTGGFKLPTVIYISIAVCTYMYFFYRTSIL